MSATPYRSERMMQADLTDLIFDSGGYVATEVDLPCGRADMVIPLIEGLLVVELKSRPRATTLIGAVHQVLAYGHALQVQRRCDTTLCIVIDVLTGDAVGAAEYIRKHAPKVWLFDVPSFENFVQAIAAKRQWAPIHIAAEGAQA